MDDPIATWNDGMPMPKDNVDYLPIWKKDATPYERFEELALIARKHPERFQQFNVTYLEKLKNGRWKVRTFSHACNLAEEVGLMHLGLHDIMRESSS